MSREKTLHIDRRVSSVTKIALIFCGALTLLVMGYKIITASLGVNAAGSIELSYKNGTRLDQGVTFDNNKIDHLYALVDAESTLCSSPSGSGWRDGYYSSTVVGKFIEMPVGSKTWSGVSWKICDEKRDIDITVTLEETFNGSHSHNAPLFVSSTGRTIIVSPMKNAAGDIIYDYVEDKDGEDYPGIFIKFNLKATRHNSTEKINYPRVYYYISDIDNMQAFKLTDGQTFAKSKLFAREHYVTVDGARRNVLNGNFFGPETAKEEIQAANKLQNNFFNSENGTIYSGYCTASGANGATSACSNGAKYGRVQSNGYFDEAKTQVDPDKNTGDAGVYAQLTSDFKENGMGVIYGYRKDAGSTISFYTELYTVKYIAETGGAVGKSKEDVFAENKPVGSTTTANEGWIFKNWTSNQAVTVDGTTISAGSPITMEQIKKIVVDKDLSFTAHFIKLPKLVMTKKADKESYTVGEYVHYSLKVNQAIHDAVANNVVISDKLSEENIISYEPDSFQVFFNDEDVTKKEGTIINVNNDGFSIKVPGAMTEADTIAVLYDAKALTKIDKLTNFVKATCDESEAAAKAGIDIDAEADFAINIIPIPEAPGTGFDRDKGGLHEVGTSSLIYIGGAILLVGVGLYIYKSLHKKIDFSRH